MIKHFYTFHYQNIKTWLLLKFQLQVLHVSLTNFSIIIRFPFSCHRQIYLYLLLTKLFYCIYNIILCVILWQTYYITHYCLIYLILTFKLQIWLNYLLFYLIIWFCLILWSWIWSRSLSYFSFFIYCTSILQEIYLINIFF